MRSRIVAGLAFFLGLVMVSAMLFSSDPIQWKPFLGGVAFIALGGYYLFTGKREASLTEFIRDGKISSGKPQEPEAK